MNARTILGMTRQTGRGLLIPLLAMAGGCINQQADIAKYQSVINERWTAAQPNQLGPQITLVEAMGAANAHNERLGLSGEAFLQALIEKDRAAANFLPTISLAPTYSWTSGVKSSPTGGGANHSTDVPIAGQVNIFNGFRDISTYRRAGFSVEQQRQLLYDAQEQVLLDVAQTYYQILRAERSVGVLENSLKVQEERIRDIRARQKAGLARPLDVAQTEAQASATRVSLISARNDVRVGREVLSFLIGLPVGNRVILDSISGPSFMPLLIDMLGVAYANRADLVAAAAAVQVARQNVEIAIGRYYPSVSLNLEYFLKKESSPTDAHWLGLLSANLPIFSAGQIEAGVRTAWSQLRQAKMSEQALRRQVQQQVAVALQNLQFGGASLAELEVQVKAAGEAFQQADQSYNVGLATNLERLTAQDQLLTAQLQQTSTRFNYTVLYLNLLRTIGRLGPEVQARAATRPATGGASMPATLPATVPMMPRADTSEELLSALAAAPLESRHGHHPILRDKSGSALPLHIARGNRNTAVAP